MKVHHLCVVKFFRLELAVEFIGKIGGLNSTGVAEWKSKNLGQGKTPG